MSVSAVGASVGLTIQSLVGMRKQLDELQRQLGTGKKSTDYAGVGVDRGVAVGLRSRLSTLNSYGTTITGVGVRSDLAKTALERMITINSDTQTTIRPTRSTSAGRRRTSRMRASRSTSSSDCS